MRCKSCGTQTAYAVKTVTDDDGNLVDRCNECSRYGGSNLTSDYAGKITLRARRRIQDDREKYAADIVQPFVKNKPNPEFAKIYPERVKDYYTDREIRNL